MLIVNLKKNFFPIQIKIFFFIFKFIFEKIRDFKGISNKFINYIINYQHQGFLGNDID